MEQFVYQGFAAHVLFGNGAAHRLGEELDRLAITRAVILCSPARTGLAEEIAAAIGGNRAAVSPASLPNMPQSAYDRLSADAAATGAEAVIALGGGSPIGLGKAWAAETEKPLLAVVTTYSGSEMASNWYVGDGPDRRTGNAPAALPVSVIYDPLLTLDLPPAISAASGMNAMAHAVESLYGPDANPVIRTMAEDAIRRLGRALPLIVDNPHDTDARSEALYAAWLAAGFRAKSGLEHVLAQRVRSRFGLGHAVAHAVALPYAVAFNAPAAPDAMRRIERALGVGDAASGLYDLNRRLGLDTGFAAIGMPANGIDDVADIIAGMEFPNPRPADRRAIGALVAEAFAGRPPTTTGRTGE